MSSLIKKLSWSLAFSGALFVQSALADYPEKTITMLIPYGAGGGTDVLARSLQPALEESLGQTIVVKNMPGGGGILGFTKVANSRADGYTVTIPNNVIFATEGMGNATYKYKEFDYLGNVLTDAYVVAARADGPWNTWQDFTKDMQEHPNKIKFGFSGFGGSTHVASEILASEADYKAKQIPHDGSSKAVVAALGGHIDALMLNLGDVSSAVKSGKLKLLLTLGEERLPDYPNVPTLKELGYDLVLNNWRGIAAPAGVSDEVKEAWNKALAHATNDPKFKQLIMAQGNTIEFIPSGDKLNKRMYSLAESFVETAHDLKK